MNSLYDSLRGGAPVRAMAEEGRRVPGWFYLSFAHGQGFLGAAIVWAHGVLTAVKRAADLGLNPGGEVVCCAIPPGNVRRVPPHLLHRLLTEAEVRVRLAGRRIGE